MLLHVGIRRTSSSLTASSCFELLDEHELIEPPDGGWANTDASKSLVLLSSAGVVVDRCCSITFDVQDCVRDSVAEKESFAVALSC